MMSPPSVIERAYQLARSGEYPRLVLVKAQLRREGYADVTGRLAEAQASTVLRIICEEAYRLKTLERAYSRA